MYECIRYESNLYKKKQVFTYEHICTDIHIQILHSSLRNCNNASNAPDVWIYMCICKYTSLYIHVYSDSHIYTYINTIYEYIYTPPSRIVIKLLMHLKLMKLCVNISAYYYQFINTYMHIYNYTKKKCTYLNVNIYARIYIYVPNFDACTMTPLLSVAKCTHYKFTHICLYVYLLLYERAYIYICTYMYLHIFT
jgi:hypothetical protein